MPTYRFVDLFAGCGGFSLGLLKAGLQGSFAVERDAMAFTTFAANLAGTEAMHVQQFDWPDWLPRKNWDIEALLREHLDDLVALRGSIDILAGGPPCQGFSFAGRRKADDPRNMLFEKYVEVVEAIQPQMLILENVPGMRVAHGALAARRRGASPPPIREDSYYDLLVRRLQSANYSVDARLLDARLFGVPQRRSRLIVVGVRNDAAARLDGGVARVFDAISTARTAQLKELGLSSSVSAKEALSDLETRGRPLHGCTDPLSRGTFSELKYEGPRTPYQRLMRAPCPPAEMNSMRLARHSPKVTARFVRIIAECQQGTRMNDEDRARFGLKKHRIYPMHGGEPAPTITTLPDDVLHYSEPRILTVRESARIQSFPDWFEFHGKFTTGGIARSKECPRYTQVGNAVPPLMAQALGRALCVVLEEISNARDDGGHLPIRAVA